MSLYKWKKKKKKRWQGTALQRFCLTGAESGARPRCEPRVRSCLKSPRCLRRKPFTSSARRMAACRRRIYPVSWTEAAHPIAPKRALLHCCIGGDAKRVFFAKSVTPWWRSEWQTATGTSTPTWRRCGTWPSWPPASLCWTNPPKTPCTTWLRWPTSRSWYVGVHSSWWHANCWAFRFHHWCCTSLNQSLRKKKKILTHFLTPYKAWTLHESGCGETAMSRSSVEYVYVNDLFSDCLISFLFPFQPSENDQLKFDSHVLLHDMVSQVAEHALFLFGKQRPATVLLMYTDWLSCITVFRKSFIGSCCSPGLLQRESKC